jgi:hypothetical protein
VVTGYGSPELAQICRFESINRQPVNDRNVVNGRSVLNAAAHWASISNLLLATLCLVWSTDSDGLADIHIPKFANESSLNNNWVFSRYPYLDYGYATAPQFDDGAKN